MALDCDRPTDALLPHPIARREADRPVQIFLWFLLFLLVVAGVVLVVRSAQQRREREQLWGALKDEPSFPGWNEDSLGVGPVRVHSGVSHYPEDEALAGPIPDPVEMPEPEEMASDYAHLDAEVEASEVEPSAAGPVAAEPALAPRSTLATSDDNAPRPMRPRPEWWEEDAPGTGALLRSLVEATGGSAALVRPDPSDDGYLILAAAGPAASTLDVHRKARRFEAPALTDLPREPVTVVLAPGESGVLPGMEPDAVGETAVRALAPAPAPRRLLVVDVPAEHPLDARAERLLDRYADLLADVLGLPTEAPLPEPATAPSDPLSVAMEVIADEIATAREAGRAIALAIVVPYEQETLMEADPEAVSGHESALRERLETVRGTRAITPMGALVFGALCDAEAGRAEQWAQDVSAGGPRLRIGMAIYGPRHVTPDHLRQDAAHALHQTYSGDDTCVIVE